MRVKKNLVALLLVVACTQAFGQPPECPCFSPEEVESIFVRGDLLSNESGGLDCTASDYSVEYNAEVTVWDKLYTLIAQAIIEWYDYDRSQCQFVDNEADPPVERAVTWDQPAEDNAEIANACFKIIAGVITKLDSSGKCSTFP